MASKIKSFPLIECFECGKKFVKPVANKYKLFIKDETGVKRTRHFCSYSCYKKRKDALGR